MDSESRPIAGLPCALAVLCAALLSFAAGARPATAAGAPPPFERTETSQPCARFDPLRRPVLRRPARAHRPTRSTPAPRGRATCPPTPTALRAASASACNRTTTTPAAAPSAARAAARLRGRHRPRRALRRAHHLQHPRPARATTRPSCIIYRHFPRLAFFLANSQVTNSDAPLRFSFCGPDGALCRAAARTPWRHRARRRRGVLRPQPACRFTTFVGYEWTGAPGSNNIHRNVIFRNAAVPDLPITYVEAPRPAGAVARARRGASAASTAASSSPSRTTPTSATA